MAYYRKPDEDHDALQDHEGWLLLFSMVLDWVASLLD